MQTKFIKNKLNNVLLIIIVFFLTRQIPFSDYSEIMGISVMIMAAMALGGSLKSLKGKLKNKTIEDIVVIVMLMLLVFEIVFIAIFQLNISNAIRSCLILISILLTKDIFVSDKTINIAIDVIFLQAIFVVSFLLYMIIFSDMQAYSAIRAELALRNWGDVYTHGDGFWNIKLVGSALLPVGFFSTLIFTKGKKKAIYSIVFAISCFVSNLAFLVAGSLFAIIYYANGKERLFKNIFLIISIAGVLLSLVVIFFYYDDINLLGNKEDSFAVRVEQIKMLKMSLEESAWSTLFGAGLGREIYYDGLYRTYNGDVYYELQALYFLVQLGYLGFFVFSAISLYFIVTRCKTFIVRVAIILYFLYAATNPYVFDTTHFFVLVFMYSIDRSLIGEKNNSNIRCIQPKY